MDKLTDATEIPPSDGRIGAGIGENTAHASRVSVRAGEAGMIRFRLRAGSGAVATASFGLPLREWNPRSDAGAGADPSEKRGSRREADQTGARRYRPLCRQGSPTGSISGATTTQGHVIPGQADAGGAPDFARVSIISSRIPDFSTAPLAFPSLPLVDRVQDEAMRL
ncbi:hypothetical protein [Pseudogemmobacter humi]|uniref:hypothetical protein n=1 Tax=Pseudogemmobacter humi TaxID=2483812 RepID=UPI00135A3762|nr:hypothetical protein [Pseudogemmobacter humi]